MSIRSTTIAISEGEKNDLDEVAEQVFGESESIPYGATISMLVEDFHDN